MFSIVAYTQGLPFAGDTLDTQALGGAETAFIHLCRELHKAGHRVQAFCNCPAPGDYDGVAYNDVASFPEWTISQECDLFICSRMYQVFRYNIPARVKTLWLHDHLLEKNAAELRPLLPFIDWIFCVSNYHADYTTQLLRGFDGKIRITQNAVDHELIAEAVRQARPKKNQIMFTSRPERGLAEALAAYARLNDKTLTFLFCTYPYPGEKPESNFSDQLASLREQGFSVITGQYAKRDLYRHIAESRLVVYPANTPEIFCLAAVEAQACGTAFLGRAFGAIDETVGYPCQRGNDPEEFFLRMKTALSDEQLRATFEQQGHAHVQRYTWANVCRDFIQATAPLIEAELDDCTANNTKVLTTAGAIIDGQRAPGNGSSAVVCLMEAKGTLLHIKRSIESFLAQDHLNRQLLIRIVDDRLQTPVTNFLRQLASSSVTDVSGITDEAIYNYYLTGPDNLFVCWWHTDTIYHPTRIGKQLDALLTQDADCLALADTWLLNAAGDELSWVTLDRIDNSRLQQGTLFVRAARIQAAVFRFAGNTGLLQAATPGLKKCLYQRGLGYLYLVQQDGVVKAEGIRQRSALYLQRRKEFVDAQLCHFPVKRPLAVVGRNGKAFIWNGESNHA